MESLPGSWVTIKGVLPGEQRNSKSRAEGSTPSVLAASDSPGLARLDRVELLALRRHLAEQLGRLEALAVFLGERLALGEELRHADHVHVGQHAAAPRREAPAQHRADVAVVRGRHD